MDIYLYSKTPDLSYACTNLADLQALIAALVDPQDSTNAATILRVTSKLPPMTQGDTGEPLNVYSYDDASTVSSWVTDVAAGLWAGLGDPIPNGVYAYAITSDFSISGDSKVGTLALNTSELQAALNSVVNHRRAAGMFKLQLRKSVGGVTETVALLDIEVASTVLSAAATDLDPTVYLTVSEAATSYQPKDADLTSIAGNTTGGFLTRTASGTYTPRTITGTAGQVTVTNGDGVSGAPTISLPSTITQATTFSAITTVSGGVTTAATNDSATLFTATGAGYASYQQFFAHRNAGNSDSLSLGQSGSAYAGSLGSVGNSQAYIYSPARLTIARGTGATNGFHFDSTGLTVTPTTASTSVGSGALTVAGGCGIAKDLFVGEGVYSVHPTDGVGYATGAGGTVTQATSRNTGVTINTVCGSITLVSAAAIGSWQSFTVTNSAVAATDTIILNQKSGTDLYLLHVTAVAAGSFRITFITTGGTTTEQPVFNFAVIKAVAA